ETDEASFGRERSYGELIEQVILQRSAAGDGRFERVLVAFKIVARLDGRPIAQLCALLRNGRRGRVAVVDIFLPGIEIRDLGEVFARKFSVERLGLRLGLGGFRGRFDRSFVTLQ